jgi:hypothetical protein
MRVSSADLAALRAVVAPLDTAAMRDIYRARDIPRGELVKDINKRYRWDLMWSARGHKVLQGIDDYADAHIDTALRAVVPPL